MSETKPSFQSMNGCAACKLASEKDPAGRLAAVHGKSYWCQPLGKPVDAKDGASCSSWAIGG